MYKYSELQVSIATQKLSCKANYKTPIFLIVCAPWNLFGNGTSTPFYKPLDLDVWPKSRNRKKICHPSTFKLSILQENKWEVGQTLETTLLTPSKIPPLGYGWIYCFLLRLPENRK
jgi:hypothetical protein